MKNKTVEDYLRELLILLHNDRTRYVAMTVKSLELGHYELANACAGVDIAICNVLSELGAALNVDVATPNPPAPSTPPKKDAN